MKEFVQTFRKKGWTEHEIQKTISSFKKAELKKHLYLKKLESIIFWIALFIMIIGNLIVAIGITPLIMILSGKNLYITMIIIGLLLGVLFNFLIKEMSHLEIHHHIIIAIFIPVIAILSLFMITTFSNYLILALGMNVKIDNPALVGFTYAISLSLPYIINRIEKAMS